MWSKCRSKITNKVVLEDFKIYIIYIVHSYHMKKICRLNFSCLFLPKHSKTLYSGHLVIEDTFLGTTGVRYRQI